MRVASRARAAPAARLAQRAQRQLRARSRDAACAACAGGAPQRPARQCCWPASAAPTAGPGAPRPGRAAGAAVEPALQPRRAAARCHASSAPQPGLARLRDQLGGGGGRRRAQVGAEVGDGEVGLVADAADQRHRAAHDGARQRSSLKAHRSSIEPPPRTSRITSTAPRLRPGVERSQRRAPARPAPARPAPRPAPARPAHAARAGAGGHHVVQRRGAERRDHADAARQQRQRPLAAGVEQALRPPAWPSAAGTARTARPARPGAWLRRSAAGRRAARRRQAAPHLDQVAVARREVQQAGRAAEHGAADLALRVLQREVAMPAGCAREARNLAADRDRVEARIQGISNGAAQRPDLPDRGADAGLGGRASARPRPGGSGRANLLHSARRCAAAARRIAAGNAAFLVASH